MIFGRLTRPTETDAHFHVLVDCHRLDGHKDPRKPKAAKASSQDEGQVRDAAARMAKVRSLWARQETVQDIPLWQRVAELDRKENWVAAAVGAWQMRPPFSLYYPPFSPSFGLLGQDPLEDIRKRGERLRQETEKATAGVAEEMAETIKRKVGVDLAGAGQTRGTKIEWTSSRVSPPVPDEEPRHEAWLERGGGGGLTHLYVRGRHNPGGAVIYKTTWEEGDTHKAPEIFQLGRAYDFREVHVDPDQFAPIFLVALEESGLKVCKHRGTDFEVLFGIPRPAPEVGTWWRHSATGGVYQVTGIARLEATDEEVVVYRASSGSEYVRPVKEWEGEIAAHIPYKRFVPHTGPILTDEEFLSEPAPKVELVDTGGDRHVFTQRRNGWQILTQLQKYAGTSWRVTVTATLRQRGQDGASTVQEYTHAVTAPDAPSVVQDAFEVVWDWVGTQDGIPEEEEEDDGE